jgi:cytochrome c oxidase subunit IV
LPLGSVCWGFIKGKLTLSDKSLISDDTRIRLRNAVEMSLIVVFYVMLLWTMLAAIKAILPPYVCVFFKMVFKMQGYGFEDLDSI